MWPNPQETADLVTFIAKIVNGELHFLCSVCCRNAMSGWIILERGFTCAMNMSNNIQKELSRGVLRKRCSDKYAVNLEEKTHAKEWFQ